MQRRVASSPRPRPSRPDHPQERDPPGTDRPEQQTEPRPRRRVGPGHRALQHAKENVVALCDVNALRTKEGLELFPKAKAYSDWRRMMDQKDIEGVIICTADHHHAFIANWALNRNMHVYCEKPLGISVEETRVVRANYLSKRAKLATQHGTQRHAYPNFERLRELILDGAIGELKTVHSWDARQLPRPGYPKGRRPAARRPGLRTVDRTVAVPSLQPAVLRRDGRPELPLLEHVPRFRSRPDGRHGRPHDGPGVERHRRRRADRDRHRPRRLRQVQPRTSAR